MIKNIDCFIELKKKEYYNNYVKNKEKKEKKQKRIEKNFVNEFNKKDKVYYFGIDKVYNLSKLHSLINWYKYYIELYLNDLFLKYENIQNNKINLK